MKTKLSWMLPSSGRLAAAGAIGGATLGAGSAALHNRNLQPGQQRASVLGRAAVGAGVGGLMGVGAKKVEGAVVRHKQWGNYKPPEWAAASKSKGEAKAAYRQQALAHHPDRGGDTGAFQGVNQDWEKFQKSPHFQKLGSNMVHGFLDELEKIADSAVADVHPDIMAVPHAEREKLFESFLKKHHPSAPRSGGTTATVAEGVRRGAVSAAPAEQSVVRSGISRVGTAARRNPRLALGAMGALGVASGVGAMSMHHRRNASAPPV